ncbi:MAG: MBL fold metallo-hydrolase [Myxococcota bacterium]
MKPIIGDRIRIDRILEHEQMAYPGEIFLPTLDPAALDEHRQWLVPRFYQPDPGLFRLSLHSYLIRTERHTILVDACAGNGKDRPDFPEFHQLDTPYLANLRALGVEPADIDMVLCTHLHVDHIGWNTQLRDGRWVPTFPNARYLFSRTEWQHWSKYAAGAVADDPYPPPVTNVLRQSYRDSVAPIVAAERHVLIDSDHELSDGIQLASAPGHSPGHAIVRIAMGDVRATLTGDTVHHPIQVHYPECSSGFCYDPVQSAETRRRVLEEHADTGVIVLPAHFLAPTAGRVRSQTRGFAFEFVD